MNLATSVDVQFGDDKAFRDFLFVHLIAHNTISEYIEDQNVRVDNYPLDNAEEQRDWLFTHNLMHQAIAQRLGLTAPQDLELYDLRNRSEFDDWMSIHGQEHDRIYLVMGY